MEKVTFTVEDGKLLVTLPGVEGACVADPGEVRQCLSELGVAPGGERGATFSESGVISFAQARALLSEAEAQGKFIPASEVFRAQAEQELHDAVQAGKILPRQRDDWRKIALNDLPTFHKLMAAQKALVPLAPVGLSGAPPEDVQEQVKFMAEQRMRERKITFGQALSEIGREQPQLVQQYRRAVSTND